jgi:hypothetical protein
MSIKDDDMCVLNSIVPVESAEVAAAEATTLPMDWQAALYQFRQRPPDDPELNAKLRTAVQACRSRTAARRSVLASSALASSAPNSLVDEAVTVDILLHLYVTRRGRCAICDGPMTVGPITCPNVAGTHSHWAISVDRVDASSPDLPYVFNVNGNNNDTAETAAVAAATNHAKEEEEKKRQYNCRLVHNRCNSCKSEDDALSRAQAHHERLNRLVNLYEVVVRSPPRAHCVSADAAFGSGLGTIFRFEKLVGVSVDGPLASNTGKRPPTLPLSDAKAHVSGNDVLWKRCHASMGCNEWRPVSDFDVATARLSSVAATGPGAYGEIETGRWYASVCRWCSDARERQQAQARIESSVETVSLAAALEHIVETENRALRLRALMHRACGTTGLGTLPVAEPVPTPRHTALAQWAAQRGLCARCTRPLPQQSHHHHHHYPPDHSPEPDRGTAEKDQVSGVSARWLAGDGVGGVGWRWVHPRCAPGALTTSIARRKLQDEASALTLRLRSLQRAVFDRLQQQQQHVAHEVLDRNDDERWLLEELKEQAFVIARQAVECLGWTRDPGRAASTTATATLIQVRRDWDDAFDAYRRFNIVGAESLINGRAQELATASLRRAEQKQQNDISNGGGGGGGFNRRRGGSSNRRRGGGGGGYSSRGRRKRPRPALLLLAPPPPPICAPQTLLLPPQTSPDFKHPHAPIGAEPSVVRSSDVRIASLSVNRDGQPHQKRARLSLEPFYRHPFSE